MQSTNKLGLKVAGVSTISVLLISGAIYAGKQYLERKEKSTTKNPSVIQSSELITEKLVIPNDKDRDGLDDDVELLYRADPKNPDTDGDGTLDGEEISLLRDPALAASQTVDDTLTGLTIPGDSGDIDASTYTGRYITSLPQDATQSDVLSSEKLEAFIEQESGDLLPEVPLSDIKQSQEEGASAVETYLEGISATHNKDLVAVTSEDITTAFQAAYTDTSGAALQTIIDSLTDNLLIIRAVASPRETVVLHQKILSASEALLTNVELLATMQTDFVGGLIGAKNIEALGAVFNEISQEISALETKYNLE